MEVDFSAADCRWNDDTPSKGGTQAELHVTPKTDDEKMCKDLKAAIESGESVLASGRSYNSTRYTVLREEAGTFVLVNARGMR